VIGERLVGEHARRADLHEVAAELVLEDAVLVPPEIHVIVRGENVEVVAPRIVAIKANAAVARDAPVHLVLHEGTDILVAERPLPAAITAVVVARHDGHVLQVTLAAFLADGAVVRMVDHEPLDHVRSERMRLGLLETDACTVLGRRHAGHDDAAFLVMLVRVLLDGTLAAGADRAHRRVPAEVRDIEAERKNVLEQILLGRGRVGYVVDIDRHRHPLQSLPLRAAVVPERHDPPGAAARTGRRVRSPRARSGDVPSGSRRVVQAALIGTDTRRRLCADRNPPGST
jgi:hypothetical protein